MTYRRTPDQLQPGDVIDLAPVMERLVWRGVSVHPETLAHVRNHLDRVEEVNREDMWITHVNGVDCRLVVTEWSPIGVPVDEQVDVIEGWGTCPLEKPMNRFPGEHNVTSAHLETLAQWFIHDYGIKAVEAVTFAARCARLGHMKGILSSPESLSNKDVTVIRELVRRATVTLPEWEYRKNWEV